MNKTKIILISVLAVFSGILFVSKTYAFNEVSQLSLFDSISYTGTSPSTFGATFNFTFNSPMTITSSTKILLIGYSDGASFSTDHPTLNGHTCGSQTIATTYFGVASRYLTNCFSETINSTSTIHLAVNNVGETSTLHGEYNIASPPTGLSNTSVSIDGSTTTKTSWSPAIIFNWDGQTGSPTPIQYSLIYPHSSSTITADFSNWSYSAQNNNAININDSAYIVWGTSACNFKTGANCIIDGYTTTPTNYPGSTSTIIFATTTKSVALTAGQTYYAKIFEYAQNASSSIVSFTYQPTAQSGGTGTFNPNRQVNVYFDYPNYVDIFTATSTQTYNNFSNYLLHTWNNVLDDNVFYDVRVDSSANGTLINSAKHSDYGINLQKGFSIPFDFGISTTTLITATATISEATSHAVMGSQTISFYLRGQQADGTATSTAPTWIVPNDPSYGVSTTSSPPVRTNSVVSSWAIAPPTHAGLDTCSNYPFIDGIWFASTAPDRIDCIFSNSWKRLQNAGTDAFTGLTNLIKNVFPISVISALNDDINAVSATSTPVNISLTGAGNAFKNSNTGTYYTFLPITSSTTAFVINNIHFDYRTFVDYLVYAGTAIIIISISIKFIKGLSGSQDVEK